jgi:hypothetical protein
MVLFAATAALGFARYVPRLSPAGAWSGTYASPESGGQLWLAIDSAASGWTARLKVTSAYVDKPEFRECSNVRVTGDSVSFTVNWGGAVHWKGAVRGATASGIISTDHWAGTWKATRDTTGRRE